MKLYGRLVVWFICFILLLDWSFELITMASTIANIAGIVIAFAACYVTLKTKCFTTITFKKHKDEKSN